MRWSWSNRLPALLLPALFAGGELAWAWLWLAWFCRLDFAAFGRPALSWPASAVLLALAIAVTRPLLRGEAGERRSATVVLATGVVAVIVAAWLEHSRRAPAVADLADLPDRLAHAGAADTALVFGAYLWWRGIAIARSNLHFDDAYVRFVFGLGALIAAPVATGASGAAVGRAAIALLVLQFFLCALPALAITRLEDIRRERIGGEGSLGLSREWLGVLGLTVLGILLLALLLVSTVSADVARALSASLNVAADALSTVLLYTVFLPLGFVAALLVYLLRAVIALLGGGKPQPFEPPPSPDDLRQQAKGGTAHAPPFVLDVSKWALLVLVVGIVATVIVRAVFRYHRGRGEEVEEIHESLWQGSVLAALWAWLLARLGRFRRRPTILPAEPYPATVATDPTARSVRELYRAWLGTAAERGRPREPAQTADEFLTAGAQLLPEASADLEGLTRAYERARYGAPPLPEPVTDAARAAWTRIRASLALARAQDERDSAAPVLPRSSERTSQ